VAKPLLSHRSFYSNLIVTMLNEHPVPVGSNAHYTLHEAASESTWIMRPQQQQRFYR